MIRRTLVALLLAVSHQTGAQEFFNLTAQDVRIDSLLPVFSYQKPLGCHYVDSVYTVSIEYPEFIPMSKADIQCYRRITCDEAPEMPEVRQHIGVARKEGVLDVQLVPIVKRDGRYQKLVSFKLNIQAKAKAVQARTRVGETAGGRYAGHSVLREGTWVKIRIPETGVYQLSSTLIKKCGFADLTKVRVFGYGGGRQPESLTGDYLTATDDLQEVPTCTVGDKRLFYAVGPVTWESATALTRQRNNYSDYGYYFLTEGGEPLSMSEEAFRQTYYPAAEHYHTLYEIDDYAWFHGGRKLFDSALFTIGTPRHYTLGASSEAGTLTVAISYDADFEATVSVNGQEIGRMTGNNMPDSYTKAGERVSTFRLDSGLKAENTIQITQTSGAHVRLDYLAITSDDPVPAIDLTQALPTPEYVGHIAHQDHHADEATDMVILIPASQKWRAEAERLKTLHEERDGLRVRVIPADELYNEYSSGTPDANAYRRYLKMLYDRAETPDEAPRYLLLMGDGAWDNRMRISDWNGYSPDDFLLCYESENSFSEVDCYVSDDYFCLLDDEEQIQQTNGGSLTYLGKPDVAVGRLSARTTAEAKILTDKTIAYANNEAAGAWQNTICIMGDDGNNNVHMATADRIATMVQDTYPGYDVRKVYWDAYTRQTSSTGNSYPEVTTMLKNQMNEGALLMNYSGHGISYALSHEFVLKLADFEETTSAHLPLWVTASCDIMPFDGQEENIGETVMMNGKGGAIAFFGTTRTVYTNYNEVMNVAFTRYVLGTAGSKRVAIGEAARLAKCELVELGSDRSPNKLQYTLLGDPALVLAAPTQAVVIDEINGQAMIDGTTVSLAAGTTATVKGHIVANGSTDNNFSGIVTACVRDAEETIVCRRNNSSETDVAFTYQDRTKTIYNGSDSVRGGMFTLTFAVPKDISYTDGAGLMTLYAVNTAKTIEAHGENGGFVLNGSSASVNDSIGPGIYCYLNTSSFVNGGKVNATPYFVADLYDDNGINASGSSIGHDLELIIDGDMNQTYNLNQYFSYEFGDYRSGKVGFRIPQLTDGKHQLLFRAWDVMNNSSTAVLDFEVVKNASIECVSVDCTRNPATNSTTFIVTHDRAGCTLDVQLDVYDTSGRQLWQHREKGVSADNTYTFDWDLAVDGGRRLQTGVYLFRVSISSEGSAQSSKTKKLIVIGNN